MTESTNSVGTEDPVQIYHLYDVVTLDNGSQFNIANGNVAVAPVSVPLEGASNWPPHVASPGYCSYHNGQGWVFAKDVRTMTVADFQYLLITKANRNLDQKIKDLGSGYSDAEKASFSQQLADSKAVLAGGEPTTLLSALAVAQGVTVEQLATKVVANDQAYQEVYLTALAECQRTKATVQAAKSIKDLPQFSIHDFRGIVV